MRIGSIAIVLLLQWACSQQYFDQPQPIDGKNIYAFPKALQGIWTDGQDSLIVANYFFANIEYSSLSLPYTQRDTTAFALFRNGKAYPYDSIRQQVVGIGTSYRIENDSIYYEIREVLEVQLGRKAFLRQVGNQFVLNVKGDNGWWELFLMAVTNQDKVVVTYPTTDELLVNEIKPVLSNTEEDYYEVRWTTKTFNQMIGKNVFTDTLLFVDRQN